MISRRTLRELGMAFGLVVALLSYNFAASQMISWAWGAPLMAGGGVLAVFCLERRRGPKDYAMLVGATVALLAYGFSTTATMRWCWAAPLMVLGGIMIALSLEWRRNERRWHR